MFMQDTMAIFVLCINLSVKDLNTYTVKLPSSHMIHV